MSGTSREMSVNYGSGTMEGLFLIVEVGPEVFIVEQILDLGEA